MNYLKRGMGYIWMLVAPAIILFLLTQAVSKINAANELTRANVSLQWVIILLIFIPICAGFFLFGKYAIEGGYDVLPASSEELSE